MKTFTKLLKKFEKAVKTDNKVEYKKVKAEILAYVQETMKQEYQPEIRSSEHMEIIEEYGCFCNPKRFGE